MTNSQPPKAPLSAWLAESLRVTVFLPASAAQPPQHREWWKALSGSDPESRSESPREASFTDEGAYKSGRLALRLEPQRIDWVYGPALPPEDGLPNIGSLATAVDEFLPELEKWLAQSPDAVRVAFGATVLVPVKDRESGYRQLQAYLPHVEVDPASEDFFYQVNRARRSTAVEGVKVNRICKWSVAILRRLRVAVPAAAAGAAAAVGFDREAVAVRLELDLNTDAARTDSLPNRGKVLHELVDLAQEIAAKGDVR